MSKQVEVLKVIGCVAGATAAAFGFFLLLAHYELLPPLSPFVTQLATFCLLLFGFFAIASFICAAFGQDWRRTKPALDIATFFLLTGTVIFTGLSWREFHAQVREMKLVYGPVANQATAAKDAAEAAKNSANAAIKQAEASQQSAKVSADTFAALMEAQRASEIFKMTNLTVTTENSVVEEHWVPVWENVGNTLAKELRTRTKCTFSDTPLDHPFDLTNAPDDDVSSASQKEQTLGKGCHGPQIEINKARAGQKYFYIFGDAKYRDIFGKRHLTEFCGTLPGSVIVSNITNMSQCHEHNCSDEDYPGFTK